ncbi:MAG TPA: EamA family transporter [Gaiellaceae bacterium]
MPLPTSSSTGSGDLARPRFGGLGAPALVLGAAISVQAGSSIAKSLFDSLGPAGAVLVRLVFGTLVLLAVAPPRRRRWTARELRLTATLGLTLGCLNLTFYEAIARAPLGVVVTIEFVGPLAVAVVGSRSRTDLLWVAIAGIGVALLADGDGGAISAAGLALALTAGALWAVYILVGGRVSRALPGSTPLIPAMAVATVLVLPLGLVHARSHLTDVRLMATGAAVGLLSSAIPWSLELEAMRRVPSRVFGVIVSLSPAVAALAGLVLLGEHLSGRSWAAVALVTVASAAAARSHSTAVDPPGAL